MLERLQASSTIIEELNGNGYSGFVDEKAISPLINNIDNSLERIISNEEKYNNHEMHVKIKALITKGVRSSLEDRSINNMADFIVRKLERYINSGFTQSYRDIEREKYFSYCTSQYRPSNEFQERISDTLIDLKDKATKSNEFNDLLTNCDINNFVSKEISQFAGRLLLEQTGKQKRIIVGGQIKLHPPKIVDTESINWHYDGDPRYIKVLCFLENQPCADGSFTIRGNIANGRYWGSHIKTIIQSINIRETLIRLPGVSINKLGLFLLNSHMPMLHERYTGKTSAVLGNMRQNTYNASKFRVVMFKGVECLHKGGNNRRYCRQFIKV